MMNTVYGKNVEKRLSVHKSVHSYVRPYIPFPSSPWPRLPKQKILLKEFSDIFVWTNISNQKGEQGAEASPTNFA